LKEEYLKTVRFSYFFHIIDTPIKFYAVVIWLLFELLFENIIQLIVKEGSRESLDSRVSKW